MKNRISNRPPKGKRLFFSHEAERAVKEICSFMNDKELAWMFANCFPNTLDTAVYYEVKKKKPGSYIITGDIRAMWLRDSAAQIWPYLQFINSDDKIKRLFQGAINKHAECVLIDSYANAFVQAGNGQIKVKERKWELDSLCYFIRLSYGYWQKTKDAGIFNSTWKRAISRVISTIKDQSDPERMGIYTYRTKKRCPEILNHNGFGNPVSECGLIRSAFRPSDDACIFQYLIPSNCFMVVCLRQLAEMYAKIFKDNKASVRCKKIAQRIDNGIKKYGILRHANGQKVFAYEVDGFGAGVFMDDANIPSLLSLPYLGYTKTDNEIYQNTRKLIFSPQNPYFYSGRAGRGMGSSHTGTDSIWPMSIIMMAMTSRKESEIIECLKFLKKTHANTGFMHEAFNKDNPVEFTRKWFGWANSLFSELIIKIYKTNKKILKRSV